MKLALDHQEVRSSLAAIAVALAGAAVMLALANTGNLKYLAAGAAGALFIIGAYISGNPRLFCLWSLAITVPFALSKQFGIALNKGGGETAFRIEMCDPFLFALLGFLIADIWSGRRPGLRIPKVTFLWILIMVVWGGAAIMFGPFRMTAAHEVARMIKATILFLVIVNELQTSRRFMHLAAGLAAGVMIQACVGLLQYVTRRTFGLDVLGETSGVTMAQLAGNSIRNIQVFRVSAFLYHPNLLGIYLGTLLPLLIGAFLAATNKVGKAFFVIVAILGMGALIATLSRSSWLSFAAAFMLLVGLMLLHPGLRRRSLMAGVIAGLALAIAVTPFAGKIIARISDSRTDAMLGRAEYKRDAKAMISVKPWLGWGLNSYVFAVPQFTRYGAREVNRWYGDWIPPVHHIYYLWWAETGLIGLAVHLTMWGSIIWVGIRNLRVRHQLLFAINAACLSAMLAFIVDGFFSFTLRVNATLRVFWILAAIIMAVHYWHLEHPTNQTRIGSLPGGAAPVA